MPRRLIVVINFFIRSVHSACQKQFSDICDLGEFRRFIIPPYSVKTTGKITESKKTKANTNPVMRTQSMKQRTISEVSKCIHSFEIFHKYYMGHIGLNCILNYRLLSHHQEKGVSQGIPCKVSPQRCSNGDLSLLLEIASRVIMMELQFWLHFDLTSIQHR